MRTMAALRCVVTVVTVTRLRTQGVSVEHCVNHMATTNLFATIINANFDDGMLAKCICNTCSANKALTAQLNSAANLSDAALCRQATGKASFFRMFSPEHWSKTKNGLPVT